MNPHCARLLRYGFYSVVVGLQLLAAPSWGAPLDTRARFLQAREAFESGRKGSVDAIGLAQQQFRGLVAAEPANPLYLAYFGSTYTLQARESTLPWTKIHLINQGVGLLDQALSSLHAIERRASGADPSVLLETRLVAIATFIALPDSLFHRLTIAKQTLQEALASPAFAVADTDLRGHLVYEGALIARQEHDDGAERSALKQVMALAPPSIDAAGIRARLAQLP